MTYYNDGFWGSLSGQVDPNDIWNDMTYKVDDTGRNFANGLNADVNQQQQRGARYDQQATGFFKQAKDALNPNSGYNQSILGMINKQASQQSADTLAQQNMFSQRNMAMQGGNSGVLAAQQRAQGNQAMGQLAQQRNANNLNWMSGLSGRASQIAGIGQGLANTASNAYTQAGNLQGQQAGLYGQYSQNMNQMRSGRAQGVAQAGISNSQNSANMMNTLISGGIGLATMPFMGPAGMTTSLFGMGINSLTG